MARKTITIIALCVFLFSLYSITEKILDYRKNAKDYNSLKEIYYTPNDIEGENSDFFDELREINNDFVGWLKIEGTNIDYPVVQGEDNQYYLDINFKGNKNSGGAIFMDHRNNPKDLDQNTVIYGHNMRDGSMFASLREYKDEDFFDENKSITLDTIHGTYHWEIYSVYESTANNYYISTHFASGEEFTEFLTHTINYSIYRREIELIPEDKILTLSTCSNDSDNGRLVIHGKLLKE